MKGFKSTEKYPWDDSLHWKEDRPPETKTLVEPVLAPIHDFTIMNAQFDDITEQVLYYPGQTYLLIMYDVNEASEKGARKAEEIYQKALKEGIKFYALTGSSDADVQKFKDKTDVTFTFWKTDPTVLKTIIRANPGLVLLKKGNIEGKWNWRDF